MNLKRLISGRTLKKTALAGLAAFLMSCPSPINTDTPSPTTPPVNELSPNTKILTNAETSNIDSVGDNSITFSHPVNYSVGDIIVADISEKTPDGLLRKVSSVSGDIIGTDSATLEEAVKNVSFSVHC